MKGIPQKNHSPEFVRGFERACTLILGTKAKWTPAELKVRNRMTRQLFGKKRR